MTTTPYAHLMPKPTSEGRSCPVCGGPTDNIITRAGQIPTLLPDGTVRYATTDYACWCRPECRKVYQQTIRDHTHRNCCPPGGPYCRLLRPRRPQPVIAAEASDGPLADAAAAMQSVAHELERADAARREWQASRQQQRREPVPADATPARVESYGQYRRRQRTQGTG